MNDSIVQTANAREQVLASLRLRTGVTYEVDLGAPWGFCTDAAPRSLFHAVTAGELVIDHPTSGRRRVAAGDLVLVPGGEAHIVRDDPATVPRDLEGVLRRVPGHVGALRNGPAGTRTQMVCGWFEFELPGLHPVVPLLPAVVVIAGESGRFVADIDSIVAALSNEAAAARPGSAAVLTRLAEALLIRALGRQLAIEPARDDAEQGWLGALRDPHVAQALALFHAQPAHRWTAGSVAAKVGVSRSALFVRFAELVGEPPLEYLKRWRIYLAADSLRRRPDRGIAEVAQEVGYGSEAAFRRAFRESIGVSPAEYRARTEP